MSRASDDEGVHLSTGGTGFIATVRSGGWYAPSTIQHELQRNLTRGGSDSSVSVPNTQRSVMSWWDLVQWERTEIGGI